MADTEKINEATRKSHQPPEYDPYVATSTYWQLPFEQRTYERVVKELWKRVHVGGPDPTDRDIKRDKDIVGRLIRNYEKVEGRVRHSVLSSSDIESSYPPLLPEIEDLLREKYRLRDVVVVDTSAIPKPSLASEEEEWLVYDDAIHRQLGIWAGRVLASLIRHDDIIAVGGGRGPYYAVMECRFPVTDCQAQKVVSLSGAFSTRAWSRSGSQENQDPDSIAVLLQGRLDAKDQPVLMNCKIIDTERKANNLKSLDMNSVTLACVGIGSLGGGHRFRRLRQIHPTISAINNLVDRLDSPENTEPPFYHSVGDVGNWFFVLSESSRVSARQRLKDVDRKKLENCVNQLNKILVNVNPKQHFENIRKKGAVLAVAGGYHKLDAIYDVLRNKWVSHLVTDSWAARKLSENRYKGH